MPRTPLAWKNLAHQPARTAVSVGGIGFAILLMFMQLGFLGAVGDAASNVYRRLRGDLVIRSPEYLHVYDARTVSDRAAEWLRALPEVAEVRTIDLGVANWQNPTTKDFRVIAVTGLDVDRPALELPGLDSQLYLLRRVDHVLMDRASRAEYGPVDGKRFGDLDVGRTTDVSGREVRIAGTFQMGAGLAANGAMITSRDGFLRIVPQSSPGQVSMALISLAPGVPLEQGRQRVLQRLGLALGELANAQALTLDEAIAAERSRWFMQTPIGVIFAVGVALAVVVGGVICYMVLAADVIAHLSEYATLKAIGYGDGFLIRTLWAQACLLATIALPPATLAALLAYQLTTAYSGIEIRMTWQRMALVTLLSYVMCNVAGLIAQRKLSKAEPASLF